MIDIERLKALAEAVRDGRDGSDAYYEALNDYGMAMAPAVTIGLIDDIERLRAELSERAANAWRVIDAKGKRFTIYHAKFAEAVAEMGLQVTPMCDLPPSGWECTRNPGHEGPCAASDVKP